MRRASWPIISPRVYAGEAREKLLRLSTRAYAFLLSLLNEGNALLRLWLLRSYAHRSGTHTRAAKLPLIGLRCAPEPLVARPPSQLHRVGHGTPVRPRERSPLASTPRATHQATSSSELLATAGWLASPCSGPFL
jgi:hypothetical protein